MVHSRTELYVVVHSSYRVVRSGTEWYIVQSCTELYIVVQCCTEWYRVVRSGTESYRVVRTSTRYRVVRSCT